MRPEDITPQNALTLVRKSNWRRAFRVAGKSEEQERAKAKAKRKNKPQPPTLSSRWHEVARQCEATPDELREVGFLLLRSRTPWEFLSNLIFHPAMPDDFLEYLLDHGSKTDMFVVEIAHRFNSLQITQRVAEEFQVDEAITTLGTRFYRSDEFSDDFFADFLKRHLKVGMLRNSLKHQISDFSPSKQQIIREFLKRPEPDA